MASSTDTPGLEWRTRKSGRVPYWVAPAEARHQGFRPAVVPLAGAFIEAPTDMEMAAIGVRCRALHSEAREWLSGTRASPHRYDGTLRSLVRLYQVHEASRYHRISPETRRSYDYNLAAIEKLWGSRRLDGLRGVDILKWHATIAQPRKPGAPPRVRFAHALMTMLRQVLGFGIVLDITDAGRLARAMKEMRFETSPPRESVITAEQIAGLRTEAHKRGVPSIALATAIMFECVLRQKDVIGEWLKDETATAAGALVDRGRVWRTGLIWGEHISRDLILSKPTSKSRGTKRAEHDLTRLPMVMDELAHVPAEKRIGPVIVCETTGKPWRARHFREEWRRIARAAGVPDDVWCMDARAGGITEGSDAGADIEHLRKAATHANVATTGRYNRDGLKKSRRVAELRVLSRGEKK